MAKEGGLIAIRATVKSQGNTKLALVIICILCFGFFTAFIASSFIEILAQKCSAIFPYYLSCNQTITFAGGLVTMALTVITPIAIFRWLMKQSYIKLTIICIATLLAIIVGSYILKQRYERLN